MTYQIIDGVEVAPADECIVCGLRRPHWPSRGGIYLADSVPLGALACSPDCAGVAVARWMKTGRCDSRGNGGTPEPGK